MKSMKNQNKHIDSNTFLADWMAGKITDSDLQEQIGSKEFRIYQKMRQAFDLIEKPAFNQATSYATLKEKLHTKETPTKKLIPNWAYAVAASLVLVLSIYQFLEADITQETTIAHVHNFSLDEGTQIHLNANSSIQHPKYQSQREVTLEGEAFFKVTKKGAFTVHTAKGTIEVLGTEFNVVSRKDFLEVICYEGKVLVRSQNKQWALTAGDAWRSIHGKVEVWNTEKPTASWLHGESSFKTTPLSFVLQSFENQYDIKLITKGIDTNVLFTGSFTHNNIQKALQSICLPLGLHSKITKNKEVILTQKKME